MSYTWAMSILNMQQMVNLVTSGQGGDTGEASKALDRATELAAQSMPEPMRSTFRGADRLQREMMDLIFSSGSFISLSRASQEFHKGADPTGRAGKRTVETPSEIAKPVDPPAQAQGWGPMP